MNMIQNLHTHTTFCDGKNTPEEMIGYAVDKGFRSLGFSGHSYAEYGTKFSMTPAGTSEYRSEIARLKEVYRDRLHIFRGLEFDMYSDTQLTGYDYIIGAMHYFKFDDCYVGFDRCVREVGAVIDRYFGGSGIEFAKRYYRDIAYLPEYGSFDILAHFDLVTKNCELADFFDADSEEYLSAAYEAIDAIKGRIPLFEVNTGAISRGYRKTPYPALKLIKEFKRQGYGAVISSDCHDGRMLDCGFDGAAELLRTAGYTERFILTEKGFIPTEL